MTAIQWISKEAKAIRKKHPKLEWSQCIKKASALYKVKHKTGSKPKKVGSVAKPKKTTTTKTHKDTKSHNVNITKTTTMSKRIKVTPLTEKELSKIGWNIFRHSGGAYFIASPLKEGISFTALSKLTLRKKASEFLSKSIIK